MAKSPFSAGVGSSLDAEAAFLKPYLDHNDNKAVILKMLQDPQLVAGYNLFSSPDDAIQNTLNLFSYGTLKDYEANPGIYLPLGEPQLAQLRRLTVLKILEDHNRDARSVVPYSAFPNQDELEYQISQLVGIGAISALLSQRDSAVCLKEICRPRDVPQSAAGADLLVSVRSMLQQANLVRDELEGTMNQLVIKQKQISAASTAASTAVNFDSMDLDPNSRSPQRHKKRRGPSHPNLPAGSGDLFEF